MTRAHLKGIIKSWTARFSAVLVAAPVWVPMLQDNFPVIAPFIPAGKQTLTLQILGVIAFFLRMRTTTSLADRGGKK